MRDKFRIIPEIIATNPDITDAEFKFYSLIFSLMGKYGYCWASNRYLADKSRKTTRSVQLYLNKFKRLGLIIIEVENENERKIWDIESWNNRKNLAEAEARDLEYENQSKILYPRNLLHPPMKFASSPANTYIDTEHKKSIKHREERPPKESWPKSVCSSSPEQSLSPNTFLADEAENSTYEPEDKVISLPRQMTDPRMPPPTPGPAEMVAETREFLSRPIAIGSQRMQIHKKDIEYFLGFSVHVIGKAIDIVCRDSKKGMRIQGIVPYLFKQCSKVRKNS